MRIIIHHDTCNHASSYSDRCLAATLRNPLGHERFCSMCIEEDGQPVYTVTLRFDGIDHTRVFLTAEEMRIAGLEGWTAFVDEPAPATPE